MRELKVFADGIPFAAGSRFRLSGKTAVGLFPSLFTLEAWNLKEEESFQLSNTKEIAVCREDACLAYGKVSDVFRQTVPEGTVTVAAFSLGLDLWEAPVSLSVEAGVSVSGTVRRLLEASGTGIRLLSFPGSDPVSVRGRAFLGRAAECIEEILTAAKARCALVPAGLCVIPADPLPASLILSEKDLADRPAYADGGRKLILSTTVTGFRPGDEMILEYGGKTASGLILERMVDADTGSGPWSTQLLIEIHQGGRNDGQIVSFNG